MCRGPSRYRFDERHYVVFDSPGRLTLRRLFFLRGTGGRPQHTSDFENLAARLGYRVIGLEYVDEPAVTQGFAADHLKEATAAYLGEWRAMLGDALEGRPPRG